MRSPRRELKQLAVVWGLLHILSGWALWHAMETKQDTKLAFLCFFSLTPIMVLAGYKLAKDAYKNVPMEQTDLETAVPFLAIFVAGFVAYKFLL